MTDSVIYTLDQLKAKLTKKERLFCHQFIIDWNGSRAAREAGYSQKTCAEIACQNLIKLHIKQYIDFIKNNLEEESGISKLRNLKELAKIAYSNVSQIHDDWIELAQWEEIKKNFPDTMAAIESIDTKTEFKTYKTDGEDETNVEIKYVKVKFYAKTPAINEINMMMGYRVPVKSELTGANGKPLMPEPARLTPEERTARINILKQKLNAE